MTNSPDFNFEIGSRRALYHVFHFIFVFSLSSTCFALDTGEWKVNSWGKVAPVADFKRIDKSCSRKGSKSSSFKVISRGDSDIELVLPGTLLPNHTYRFSVWLKSDSPVTVNVFFRRDKFPFETTAIRSIEVSDWILVSINGIHASTGTGSVRIDIPKDNVKVCINSASLTPAPFASVGSQGHSNYIDAHFFGIHLNKLGRHNGWPAFDPGTLRLWDTGTTWAQLQPTNSPIDWKHNANAQRLDYYVRHGLSKYRDLQFIYTMGMTPSWAGSKHPKNCNNSSYGSSICTAPNLEAWRHYVRALGLRYRGRIRVWEIWNEADVWVHWDNNPEELIPLVKIAAQELKSIDKSNLIIGPNITGGGLRFLSRFFAAGGGHYLDGVSIHAYLGRVPEFSFALIRNLRQFLMDAGYGDMPIWNTETGVSCNSLLEDCMMAKAENTNRLSGENSLAQGLIGNAAMGIESFVYYTWEGASLEYGNLPLVDENYQVPTKAGRVFSTIKNWLEGAQVKFIAENQSGLNVVEVRREGTSSFVLWSSGSPLIFDLTIYAKFNRYMRAGDSRSQPLVSRHLEVGSEPVMVFSSSQPAMNQN